MNENLIFDYNKVINDSETGLDFKIALYSHIIHHDISNIYIATNDYIFIDRNKHKVRITNRKFSKSAIEFLVKAMTGGESAIAALYSGDSLDRGDDVRLGDEIKIENQRARFRINISNTFHLESDGFQITIRKIDYIPPFLEKIGFTAEDERYINFFSEQGLSLVTGPTGSGKSTTCASFVQHYALSGKHVIINTYEEPIEYVFDVVNTQSETSRVYQCEIPRGMPNFHYALKKSLRRQPEIIMIGELRDPETISAAIEAGLTGHLVISTTHTNGVPETVRRLITVFPEEERAGRQNDLIGQLNIILAQRLLRTVEGKKIAVREHLIFDQDTKNKLQVVDPLKLNVEIRKIMLERNNGMLIEADRLKKDGIISKEEYLKIANIYKDEYLKANKK